MKRDNFIIENYIPIGYENRIQRLTLVGITGITDREVRRAIELSDAPIVSCNGGYFIPDMNNPVDKAYMHMYYLQERARINSKEDSLARKFGRIKFEFLESETP